MSLSFFFICFWKERFCCLCLRYSSTELMPEMIHTGSSILALMKDQVCFQLITVLLFLIFNFLFWKPGLPGYL